MFLHVLRHQEIRTECRTGGHTEADPVLAAEVLQAVQAVVRAADSVSDPAEDPAAVLAEGPAGALVEDRADPEEAVDEGFALKPTAATMRRFGRI